MIDTAGATAGQVLTYNGSTSTWVASAAPAGGSASYTIVGNASAGIFASAEIFNNVGTTNLAGTWVAPSNVTSIRLTCIGGGGFSSGGGGGGGGWCTATMNVVPGASYSYSVGASGTNGTTNGGDTRFNYAAGTTPGIGQFWCQGGTSTPSGQIYGGAGGAAKWNGFAGFAGGAGSSGYNGGTASGGPGGKGVGGGGGGGGNYVTAMGGGGGSWGSSGTDGYTNASYSGGASGGVNSVTGSSTAGGRVLLSSAALALLTSNEYGLGAGLSHLTPSPGVIIIEY